MDPDTRSNLDGWIVFKFIVWYNNPTEGYAAIMEGYLLVELLGHLLCDADTTAVEPVRADVTAHVEPATNNKHIVQPTKNLQQTINISYSPLRTCTKQQEPPTHN
jgi:hypothetical protein